MIIEPTANVFILRRDRERGWQAALGLASPPRMTAPAGGHVERYETPPRSCLFSTSGPESSWCAVHAELAPAEALVSNRWQE